MPDDDWELAIAETKDGKLEVTPSNEHLYIKGGFKPGWIYELIYETEGSKVMGLGFLGVRDLTSFLKYGDVDSAGNPNPLAGHVKQMYGFGVSLSGRVVRQYIYEGWNQDTEGRKLLDGVHSHTGSGRLLHNQRFAQVGRYPRQHEEHQWPLERYPFTFTAVPDPFSEKNKGLLQRPDTDPLIVHTHTSTDYWVRHVSTTHTDPNDGSDLDLPETTRMYNLAGAPHMARWVDDPVWVGQLTPNSMSAAPYLRASLVLLDEWVTKRVTPPQSLVPRREEGTMIEPEAALAAFPRIPGVNLRRTRDDCRTITTARTSTRATYPSSHRSRSRVRNTRSRWRRSTPMATTYRACVIPTSRSRWARTRRGHCAARASPRATSCGTAAPSSPSRAPKRSTKPVATRVPRSRNATPITMITCRR